MCLISSIWVNWTYIHLYSRVQTCPTVSHICYSKVLVLVKSDIHIALQKLRRLSLLFEFISNRGGFFASPPSQTAVRTCQSVKIEPTPFLTLWQMAAKRSKTHMGLSSIGHPCVSVVEPVRGDATKGLFYLFFLNSASHKDSGRQHVVHSRRPRESTQCATLLCLHNHI